MGRTGIYACGESVSRRNSLESVALFSLKQEAPASIGGSTFTILYAYAMLHNSSLRHKTLPMAGANDGERLFFDLWNIQANDYDAAGTAIYIAVGK